MDEYLLFGDEAFAGSESVAKVKELEKALTVGYAYGVTDQTGYAAIRFESLDSTLKWVEADETTVKHWKAIKKGKAKASVEEFAILSELGDASSYTEGGIPGEYDETLGRAYEKVKLVGAQAKVPLFAQSNDTMLDAIQLKTRMTTVAILKKLDRVTLFGSEVLIPTEPNGILTQAKTRMTDQSQNVIDLRGKRLQPEVFNLAGKVIQDNYGNPENLKVWLDNGAFQDYCNELIAKRTFMVGNNAIDEISVSAKKLKLASAVGEIDTDIFMKHGDKTYTKTAYPKVNSNATAFASTNDSAPNVLSAPTCAVTVVDDTSGLNYLPADTYDYAVVATNLFGSAPAWETKGVIVAGGKKVQFVLADNGTPTYVATKFEIYRKPSSNASLTGYQFLFSAAAGTCFDDGYHIPGTTTGYMADWNFDQVLRVDQLLPMVKMDLAYIQDAKWWLQKIYFTPKVFNGNKIVIFENIGSDPN